MGGKSDAHRATATEPTAAFPRPTARVVFPYCPRYARTATAGYAQSHDDAVQRTMQAALAVRRSPHCSPLARTHARAGFVIASPKGAEQDKIGKVTRSVERNGAAWLAAQCVVNSQPSLRERAPLPALPPSACELVRSRPHAGASSTAISAKPATTRPP